MRLRCIVDWVAVRWFLVVFFLFLILHGLGVGGHEGSMKLVGAEQVEGCGPDGTCV